ncbi:MAG TPA: MBL fold metallo-hydrolase [Actinocrinis sp.]|nr:MBL fold metallo-hydrolase [Actinocrinis sp.]
MSSVTMQFLGQAGFVLASENVSIAIDPFISDALPNRQFPPPVPIADLASVSLVLATHEHADHLDLKGLREWLDLNPELRVVLPGPIAAIAREGGVPEDNLIGMQPGEQLPWKGAMIRAVPARHGVGISDAYNFGREISGGHVRYLGYVVEIEGLRIYHSGDTLDHEGLAEMLRDLRTEVALLPVNGRDPQREAQNIVGNLSAAEAADLAIRSGVRIAVPMHYDMFANNPGSPEEFASALEGSDIEVLIPQRGKPVPLSAY